MTIETIPLAAGAPEPPLAVRETGQLARLAVPLAVANLGQVLLGAVDTMVVGRIGAVELAAGGLGSSLFFTVAVLGTGLLLGFEPLMAQALGAGERGRAWSLLGRAMLLAGALAIPLLIVGLVVGVLLEPAGIGTSTAGMARTYLYIRLLGMAPYLLFVVARSYLQARVRTRPIVASVVVANLVNLPTSWVLALGDAGLQRVDLPALGLPALGVGGAAGASVVATAAQLLLLLHATRFDRPALAHPLTRHVTQKAIGLGAPIGLALLAEYGVFSLVNLMMGNLDADSLAAHQVAITYAAVTFTVSLGVGAAAAVRVGRCVGAGNCQGTRLAGGVAFVVGAALMAVPALLFWVIPGELAEVITDQPEIVRAAIPLLWVAALFQLSDGLQAVAAGALRGAGDTRFGLLANLFGHYGCGLPLGALLAFGWGWGAVGLWWGLSVGLTAVALTLVARFVWLTRSSVART